MRYSIAPQQRGRPRYEPTAAATTISCGEADPRHIGSLITLPTVEVGLGWQISRLEAATGEHKTRPRSRSIPQWHTSTAPQEGSHRSGDDQREAGDVQHRRDHPHPWIGQARPVGVIHAKPSFPGHRQPAPQPSAAQEFPDNARAGEPGEPGTGPRPPGQDRLRQAEFSGLFDVGAIRSRCIAGGGVRERSGQRQIPAERSILQVGHQPTRWPARA